MAITRINNFEANVGSEQKLYDFLQSVISVIKNCSGCLGCQLLRSTESLANLVIIEQWESIEAHQNAASAIPAETLKEAYGLFATPPSGRYYSE